jgi:formylglycine-generating enzyme required for sulfatase activity
MNTHLARLGTVFAVTCLSSLGISGCGGAEGNADGEEGNAPATIVTESGVEMVLISGGWFEMGNEGGNEDEGPIHRVWVDPFFMDKYEVTQDQYRQLELSDPSRFQGGRLPVEQQTWIDAARFCNERSYQEGLEPCYDEDTLECDFEADGYRLPTEAEWEYFFGDDPRSLTQYAWTAENSGEKTHEVGTRRPNPWGLFDMYGNVEEWVHDYYGEGFYGISSERNPRGPVDGEYRVLRGGGWNSGAAVARSTYRSFSASVDDGCLVSDAIGFRCVRPPPSR